MTREQREQKDREAIARLQKLMDGIRDPEPMPRRVGPYYWKLKYLDCFVEAERKAKAALCK